MSVGEGSIKRAAKTTAAKPVAKAPAKEEPKSAGNPVNHAVRVTEELPVYLL